MTEPGALAPQAHSLPATPPPAASIPQDVLDDLREFLAEYRSMNTRRAYADALGAPWDVATGNERDTRWLLGGLAWLPLCTAFGVHPYAATRRHVLAWLDALTQPRPRRNGEVKPSSTSARATALSALAAYYRWLTERDLIDCTPVVVDRGRQQMRVSPTSDTRTLTWDELVALHKAAAAWQPAAYRPRNQALVALLATTGCRVSELIGLTTDDFTVDEGHRVARLQVKGGRTHQVVVFDWVWQLLLTYWEHRAAGQLVVAGQVGLGQHAFTTRTGQPLGRNEVRRVLQRCAQLAGIADPDGLHPHVFRHSLATLANDWGLTQAQVKQQLGHASDNSTSRYIRARKNYAASPGFAMGARLQAAVDD